MLEKKIPDIHFQLIERCRKGDRKAYHDIYKLYVRAMYNTAFRITGDEDDASDAVQEAFISAFRNLNTYRADSTFGAWLKRIVINRAINALNRKKFDRFPDDENFDVMETVDDEVDYGVTAEQVKVAIGQLPGGYRMVLSLYLLEGYDHEEIAGILGITVSTSKSQLNRAKKKLKEILTAN